MKTSFTLCVAILLFALVSSDVTEGGIDATHDFEELRSENIDAWVDHPAAVEEYLEVYSTLAPDTVDEVVTSEEVEIEYFEEVQSDGILDFSVENPPSEESDVTTSTELNGSSSNQLKLPSLGSVMRDLISTILMTLTYPFSYLLRLFSGKK